MEQDPDHGATILMRPPRILDYSLTGHNAERAVEIGLAEADWYQSPLPRATMRKFLERKDGPAIRDTLLLLAILGAAGGQPSLIWSMQYFTALARTRAGTSAAMAPPLKPTG